MYERYSLSLCHGKSTQAQRLTSAQFTLNLQGIVMTPSSLGLVSYYRTASDPDMRQQPTTTINRTNLSRRRLIRFAEAAAVWSRWWQLAVV